MKIWALYLILIQMVPDHELECLLSDRGNPIYRPLLRSVDYRRPGLSISPSATACHHGSLPRYWRKFLLMFEMFLNIALDKFYLLHYFLFHCCQKTQMNRFALLEYIVLHLVVNQLKYVLKP